MRNRNLGALALVLGALVLESFAFFATAMVLSLDMSHRGESTLAMGQLYTGRQGIVLLGIVAGGAVALALGPRVTAAAGALVAAGGYLAMAAGAPLLVGMGAAAFGAGVLRPCPWVIAAEALAWDEGSPAAPAPHRFAAVAAFAAAAHVAANVGGLLGPMLGGLLGNWMGFAVVYRSAGASMVLASALLAAAAVLGRAARGATGARAAGPYREAAPTAAVSAPSVGRVLEGMAILLVPQAAYWVGSSLGLPPSSLDTKASTLGILLALANVVGFCASVVVCAILAGAPLGRGTKPPLLFCGAGLLVFASGLGLLAAGSSSVVLFAVGSAVAGAGGAAVSSVPIAYAAIAIRGRAATLFVAGWSVVGALVSPLSTGLGNLDGVRTPLLAVTAALCLSAGVGLLRYGRQLHRYFDPALGA